MKNIKYLLCILVGILLTIGISSAYKLNASLVTYDKKNTTLESEQVQGAIDELYTLVSTNSNLELIWTNPNPGAEITSIVAICDYESYEYIVVTIGESPYGTLKYARNTQLLKVNTDNQLEAIGFLGSDYNRTLTYESGKITFTTGAAAQSGGKYTVPVRIYGVTNLDSLPYIY